MDALWAALSELLLLDLGRAMYFLGNVAALFAPSIPFLCPGLSTKIRYLIHWILGPEGRYSTPFRLRVLRVACPVHASAETDGDAVL